MTPAQVKAAIAYNAKSMKVDGAHAVVVDDSVLVELARFWQAGHGLEPDGKIGPATMAAIVTATSEMVAPAGHVWTPWDGPLQSQPTTRAGAYAMFGDPGTGTADPDWEKANVVTVRDMPGVPSHWHFRIHRKVEPYGREGLRRAQIACPDYEIERAACYVFRHQRHDPKRPLSWHALAIAMDIDSQLNFTKSFGPGNTPVPWTAEWNKIWPKGLPEPFVLAMESCGWHWGGRWKGFVDPMHFEWFGGAALV
jgi:hypothetical protein